MESENIQAILCFFVKALHFLLVATGERRLMGNSLVLPCFPENLLGLLDLGILVVDERIIWPKMGRCGNQSILEGWFCEKPRKNGALVMLF